MSKLTLTLIAVVLVSLWMPRTQATPNPPAVTPSHTLAYVRLIDTFTRPTHLTSDGAGWLYIADSADRKVYAYDADFQYVRAFGTGNAGDALGDLAEPGGLALLNNVLYVSDTVNNRIAYFALYGGEVGYLTVAGLSRPGALAVTGDGHLLVTSQGNGQIMALEPTGRVLLSFGGKGGGAGQFINPVGLAVDPAGAIYVSDNGRPIQKFDRDGQFIRLFDKLYGDAITSDRAGVIYLLNRFDQSIILADWRGTVLGEYRGRWNSESTDNDFGELSAITVLNAVNRQPLAVIADSKTGEVRAYELARRPTDFTTQTTFATASDSEGIYAGLAVDLKGNVYAAQAVANRIQKYDQSGNLLLTWGSAGREPGQFDAPGGLAVDRQGLVYVTDSKNARIQVFDSNGVFVRMWGTAGNGDGQFGTPFRIALDAQNFVYVADRGARILKFTDKGVWVRTFGADRLKNAASVAVDNRRGWVIVADSDRRDMFVFTANGQFVRQLNSYSEGALDVPMVVDPSSGVAYLSMAGSHSIQRYGAPHVRNDTLGVWRPANHSFYLRGSNTHGDADMTVTIDGASATDLPIAGDWNGDGIDTVGVYRPSTSQFYLWDSLITPRLDSAHYSARLGNPGDQPLAGDWNGDGRDGIGIFRPSNGVIFLRNDAFSGSVDFAMVYGTPDDIGIAGDWNGDGQDSTGTYRPSERRFYLSDLNTDGAINDTYTLDFGDAADVPFAGDWARGGQPAGTGQASVGVFRPSQGVFILRDSFQPVSTFQTVVYGAAGDLPILGTWGMLPGTPEPIQPSDGTRTVPPLLPVGAATITPPTR